MKVYILLMLPLFLSATPISILIQHTKNSHLSIKAIEYRILSINYQYKATKNFKDPVISLGLSDIQFQDSTNRSLEPMQYSSVNFQQSIPFFGKRVANGKKILAKEQIAKMDLQQTMVTLVKGIKITSYTIWQAEQLLDITKQYISLTKQDIKLYTAYSSSESSSHIQMIAARLFLSELQIKQSNLQAVIKGLYKKLSYLSNMDVLHVKLNMKIYKLKPMGYYLKDVASNKEYKLKQAALREADADVRIKKLAYYPDPYVKVGYYHRQRFKDYAGITVGFSLPIYGTQHLNEEQSQAMVLSKNSNVLNFKSDLTARIKRVYADTQSSYKIYNILTNQSIPQVQDLQHVSNAYISNGTSLFVYIDTLKRQFILKERQIIANASYHRRLATLNALIGRKN